MLRNLGIPQINGKTGDINICVLLQNGTKDVHHITIEKRKGKVVHLPYKTLICAIDSTFSRICEMYNISTTRCIYTKLSLYDDVMAKISKKASTSKDPTLFCDELKKSVLANDFNRIFEHNGLRINDIGIEDIYPINEEDANLLLDCDVIFKLFKV